MAAKRVVFSYWGRRGAMSLFALRLAEAAARSDHGIEPQFVISEDNEMRDAFTALGPLVVTVPTFRSSLGALRIDRLQRLRRIMLNELNNAARWIELMPHIWSPFCEDLRPRARNVIVHDADGHPGDLTGIVNSWLRASALRAEEVFTLSQHVADRLVEQGADPKNLHVLFHPDLDIGEAAHVERTGPLRVLFFGRVLAYKGLPLLIDAIERLRAEGRAVELGVFGEGDLGASATRLSAMGAEVVNRWLDVGELAPVFARYDVLALPYVEASQSGAAAVALAAGLPLIATPVGGLREQVRDGENGLLAHAATAEALAASLKRVAQDRALLDRLRQGAAAGASARSMDAFLTALLEATL
jgi:glycosyltransferase involved in cell wall biosynthesis